jgi:Arm DNA-binding domain
MAGRLKPLDVERIATPGRYFDGGGLYLVVVSATSRNWQYRYQFKGKSRWHGLGSFQDVSLKQARLARDAARLQVSAGVDLVQERRAARQVAKATEAAEKAKTFEECAQAYIDEHWNGWSKKHRAQWPSSLKRYAYPTIGQLTIAEIKPSHIYELLSPIWITKRETANRVRGRIETIIAKNVDVDDMDFRNPAELPSSCARSFPSGPSASCSIIPPCPMLMHLGS